ncbi:MAG: hypothetical protein QGH42_06305 [Kiritimatiellia bacterium]|jgi:hypothetical protein|nr:hypothetical protein [Kiritimatiellia bacterium]MDP6630650.1 hypothetical protein [Kiritimatiellia bacterium]MDP6809487.1 hypothetical protein [Kiritimatiellia bacterium]MDP7023836.1 hypothetical protein [Kiritimatiellia bacterium]
MKTVMTLAMCAGICLMAACGKQAERPSAAPSIATPRAFVAVEPAGKPTPIPEVRKTAKPGDEVLLKGRVMGVRDPFVEGRAVFVLGDNDSITPCNEMGSEDHCPLPWDACCDPIEARTAGTATIQLLGDGGNVLPHGLKGVGGLKELSSVTVSGVVAPMATAEALMINATAVYVAE